MIELLIALVIVVVVIYCVRLLLPYLGLPAPITNVVLIIIGLIALLWLLSAMGMWGGFPTRGPRL